VSSSDAAEPVTRKPILRLTGLSVAPAAKAAPVLAGVDLELRPGECVGLVGPSGSGKTSLLRTIAGLVPHIDGQLLISGSERVAWSRAPSRLDPRIGMITQRHDLVEPLRVDKNVMAGALGRWSRLHALRFLFWSSPEELETARAALAAVGIADKLKQPTAALSGGEQQRVAIARALVQAPVLLLADEPVASLDPAKATEVIGMLTELARERGMALLMSLHQPDLAARFCDRVFALEAKAMVEKARP
jgi:phosphonate transport system ATP-binding protein